MKSSLHVIFAVTAFFFCSHTTFALEWSTYQNFPAPALGSFGVVGTALEDGRLIVWNGDEIFIQHTLDADAFTSIASGYIGDPAFIALNPDGHTLLLGAGTGDFNNPPAWKDSLYLFDLQNPEEYSPAAVALVQPHFDGAFLNETLALIDLGKPDFSGSELAVVDISATTKSLGTVIRKSEKYNLPKTVIIDKPEFSYSGKLAVDRVNGIVYAMDANTLELRFFDVTEIIAAYQNQQTLDWATDGTLVGSTGVFFSNGVNGITPQGNLVISGSLGFLQPGGIQIVNPNLQNPSLASILSTEDPAGNQPFYAALYSAGADRIAAHDFISWYVSVRNLNDGIFHSADQNRDGIVSLQELMRIIQFYNVGGFSCVEVESSSEDGYEAIVNGDKNCASHTADYTSRDWQINLTELLRVIQLYQSLGYTVCPEQLTEDGFCPG